jgi:hypothetical protein
LSLRLLNEKSDFLVSVGVIRYALEPFAMLCHPVLAMRNGNHHYRIIEKARRLNSLDWRHRTITLDGENDVSKEQTEAIASSLNTGSLC